MSLPVVILGAGGHAKVLVDALIRNAVAIIGLTDRDIEKKGTKITGIEVMGDDEILSRYPPNIVELINGIGSIRYTDERRVVYERFKEKGYRFSSIIHPSAVIAPDVHLAEGVQIMAGAIIQAGSSIGRNTIVNTGVTVDHDCNVGAHVHLASGAVLSGNVCVEENVHIGTASTLIQGVTIGKSSFIAAGAVVIKDIPSGVTAMGVPAEVVIR